MRRFQKTEARCQMTDRVKLILFSLCSVCCILISSPGFAADFSLHGFFQGNYSLNTEGDNPNGKDFKWSEERAQLKLDASADPFHLLMKGDVFYDNMDRVTSTG